MHFDVINYEATRGVDIILRRIYHVPYYSLTTSLAYFGYGRIKVGRLYEEAQ